MKDSDFNDLPNFTYMEVVLHYQSKGYGIDEAMAAVRKIDKRLFIKLQKVRTQINRKIRINCLTEGKHVRGSYHGQGMAIDWRVLGKVNYNKVLQACLDAGFKGIGWYEWWKPRPGFHTDIRQGGVKVWKRDGAGLYKGLV